MFNKKLKEEIRTLQDKVSALEVEMRGEDVYKDVYGNDGEWLDSIIVKTTGVLDKDEKLKAIVAELCDYVYRENK